MTDPYEVLNIPSTATDEEVKKAYRDLARKYHPDNYHDNPLADLAQEKMKEINAAYHTIQQERGNRGGGGTSYAQQGYGGYQYQQRTAGNPAFQQVRMAVNRNDLGMAEQLLDRMGDHNGEWNFLKGTICYRRGWVDEARRYYLNIVGKYGVQVQALLKKAAGLDVKKILPLHGPVLEGDLSPYLEKYDLWSRYVPEEKGVALAYCSIHGNTEKAALLLRDFLAGAGETVEVFDLCRCDMSAAVAAAFRYDRLVLACPTYDGGLFPPMEDFLSHLKSKNFQGRAAALVENGSWAPISARLMGEKLSAMKDVTVLTDPVTVASAVKPETEAALKALAENLSRR